MFEKDPGWTPETAETWEKQRLIEEAEDLGEKVRKNPADQQAKRSLKKLNSQFKEKFAGNKATERAARSVIKGGIPSSWPAQKKLERAAVVALLKTSREFGRPPRGAEVIARMKRIKDQDGSWLTKGEPRDLKELLCSMGLHWLEWDPRGFQGER